MRIDVQSGEPAVFRHSLFAIQSMQSTNNAVHKILGSAYLRIYIVRKLCPGTGVVLPLDNRFNLLNTSYTDSVTQRQEQDGCLFGDYSWLRSSAWDSCSPLFTPSQVSCQQVVSPFTGTERRINCPCCILKPLNHKST
jgi:hypothetical protein